MGRFLDRTPRVPEQYRIYNTMNIGELIYCIFRRDKLIKRQKMRIAQLSTDLYELQQQNAKMVVHCRDCQYYIDGTCNCYCSPFVQDYRQTCSEPNDYCSYGRKREV